MTVAPASCTGCASTARHYDVAAVWRPYATDMSTVAVASAGHFLAEEAPATTAAAALTRFLR
jgi:hypothetical protein